MPPQAHDEQPTTMLLKTAVTGCNNRPRSWRANSRRPNRSAGWWRTSG